MKKYFSSLVVLATLFFFPPLSASQDSIATQFGSDVLGSVAEPWVPKKGAILENGVYTPKVSAGIPLAAFGEVLTASKTPQVAMRYPYDFVHPDIGQILTNKAGSSVTALDGQAVVTASATAESFSQIRTVDTVHYSPGEGSEFLGTCLFTTGAALSSQLFGAGDDDEMLAFGFNGTDFSVLRRSSGSLEIKSITITGAADADGGNFNITLDGTAVNIVVAANSTISQTVTAIVAGAADFLNAGRGWEVHTDDNITVEFISLVAEDAGGSFSFADVDSAVTAGAFSETVSGVAPTDSWVAQASWNVDPMDGSGPSGMTLDPTKGNVYRIEFQYLGYGAIRYSIGNSSTGRFQTVHIIHYENANTSPSLMDPTLHLTLIAKTEAGYSGGALVMKSASMAGFTQGADLKEGVRRSISVQKSMSTTENVLLILHNEYDFNGKRNKVSVFPDFMSYGSESTKTTILRLYKEPTEITGPAALTPIESGVSVMEYSSTGTTFTATNRLLTFIFSGGGERNLKDLGLVIGPGERYLLTGQVSSGSAALVDASFTWRERTK